ncbi:hypothetical protein NDU88_003541 [Pleurodeles waltl]|uniref:Beta/gamma crystallin 'Greek key' domain-containing protein n=1 Tax=Pleurodeles waltl TaxID=8319 RepID=A0AAV7UCU5_PLEWA|nr:hypothetical protein NDU88_003541 [Pleurodeles waltl]
MGKIVFYEDRNFQGRSHECSNDAPNLQSHLGRCNSIQVENGWWMIYEYPNYKGYQYYLNKGDYPDYQRWMGYNDSVRSCRMIQPHKVNPKIKVFEKEDLKGQTRDFTENCPNIREDFHTCDIHSCQVLEGHWLFYEEPNYRGHQYYLKPGEYKRFTDWGSTHAKVGSIRRIMDAN